MIFEFGRMRKECYYEFEASLGHVQKQGLQSQKQKVNKSKQTNIITSNKATLMFHGALSAWPHHSDCALLKIGYV